MKLEKIIMLPMFSKEKYEERIDFENISEYI